MLKHDIPSRYMKISAVHISFCGKEQQQGGIKVGTGSYVRKEAAGLTA